MYWVSIVHNGHTNLMDNILDFSLQAKPLKLNCDQFVGTHSRAVSLGTQLFLVREKNKSKKKPQEPIQSIHPSWGAQQDK